MDAPKYYFETEEMAQLVKFTPSKNKDLCSDHKYSDTVL